MHGTLANRARRPTPFSMQVVPVAVGSHLHPRLQQVGMLPRPPSTPTVPTMDGARGEHLILQRRKEGSRGHRGIGRSKLPETGSSSSLLGRMVDPQRRQQMKHMRVALEKRWQKCRGRCWARIAQAKVVKAGLGQIQLGPLDLLGKLANAC